jgi:hypothetical protein
VLPTLALITLNEETRIILRSISSGFASIKASFYLYLGRRRMSWHGRWCNRWCRISLSWSAGVLDLAADAPSDFLVLVLVIFVVFESEVFDLLRILVHFYVIFAIVRAASVSSSA